MEAVTPAPRSVAAAPPQPDGDGPGLRERKKRERREMIARHALALFAEHGFDSVRISDIARAADVATQTVFNYFPAKEDIFFHQVQEREASILDAIRRRPAGTSVLAAVRRATEDLLTNSTGGDFRDWMKVIAASESLQDYRVKIYARLADAVARHLAAEANKGPDDLIPHAVARALIGVIAASTEIVTRKITDGHDPAQLRGEISRDLDQAFTQLERGLADYGR
jgi:AcrR family transcriptional regulator